MEYLRAKKSLGQNFLTNSYVAKDIADAAEILPDETVLEVGPGTGMLTRELLEQKARVIAIEADLRAVEALQHTFAKDIREGRLALIHDDIRTYDIGTLNLEAGSYKVVANIPYYLSGMLFKLFLSHQTPPSTLVFLVQKEVANRIARDKKESALSLSVKAYGDPVYIQTISRGNFRPVPNVDSAILKVEHISKKRFATLPEQFFFEVVHRGLGSKRKQLGSNLSTLLPHEEITAIFQHLGIRPDIRGEDIDIETWLCLATQIHERLSTSQK